MTGRRLRLPSRSGVVHHIRLIGEFAARAARIGTGDRRSAPAPGDFGSRAKGTHAPSSAVDLALWGEIDALRAEAIAAEFEELPLPYRFDVQAFAEIKLAALREHIERVGVLLYDAGRKAQPVRAEESDRK
jgi:hypothetical protein